MSGEKVFNFSAEYACGQLLFHLKHSKLNYLLKETPYSAYITIRKKLLKSVDREAFESNANVQIYTSANLKDVEKENTRLNERNLEVERKFALITNKFEQLEIKCG